MRRWVKQPGMLCAWGLMACNSLSACDNTEALAAVQQQANERVALIEKQAAEKLADAQKQLETVKAEMAQAAAQAQAKAQEAIREAQESAEQAEKDANKAVHKARDGYKAEARAKLHALSEDARDLQAKAAKASAKAKASAQASLKEVAQLQKQIAKDIAAFDEATLDTFKTVKTDVNKHLSELKAKLAAAQNKLK
jgi:hypothetical protein